MTERKDFKKIVRDRMQRTGENYTSARQAIAGEPDDAGSKFGSVDEILRGAVREAQRLGHGVTGPEHGLLAIIHDSGGPARRVLLQAGLTKELVERAFGPGWQGEPGEVSVVTNPAWHKTAGRAEGLGLLGGSPAVNFVLAMLWDKHIWAQWDPTVPRASVMAVLRREGITLPAAPLPDLDRRDTFTERASVPPEHLDAVIRELARRHREEGGPRIAFNHDGDSAWVLSESGIDLQAAVDAIVDGR